MHRLIFNWNFLMDSMFTSKWFTFSFFYAGKRQPKRESVYFLTFSLNKFASLFLGASRFLFFFFFYFCSAFALLMPLPRIDDFLFSCLLCSPLLVCFEFNIFFYFKLNFSALFLCVSSLSRVPPFSCYISLSLILSLYLSPSLSLFVAFYQLRIFA